MPLALRTRFRFSAALLGMTLGLGSSSCTVIIDRSPAQCETNSECAGFPGTVCTAEKVCGTTSCTTNQECAAQLGDFHVCQKQTGACVDLRSPQCTVIEGNYAHDEALLFGVVVPTEGEAALTGLSITNAVRIAVSEFENTANGLPPVSEGASRRPLAFVGCNDNADASTGVAAAQHLASVGVPAIIGAAFSGITIKMATEVTIPTQTLLISPSATSVALTDLDDRGLVWRTSPSDVYQAKAMVQYVPKLEQTVRSDLMLDPGDEVRLAILHKGDAYGSGLGKAVEQDLELNGVSALDPSNTGNYLRFGYGDPDNPSANPTKYDEAISKALALKPHIVLLVGTTEAVVDVLQPIEEGWQGTDRPRYVLSDGGVVSPLWTYVGINTDLRRRVTGTVPGTTNDLFKGFRGEYKTRYANDGTSPDVIGTAGAYDATYLLAYSAVSLGEAPITGPALAEGLKRMVSGGLVNVGTSAMNGTFTQLQGGKSIDFNGASGPLDFDTTTGEAPSDIQIWCLPSGPGGAAQSAIGSGLYLDATSEQLAGTAGTACN